MGTLDPCEPLPIKIYDIIRSYDLTQNPKWGQPVNIFIKDLTFDMQDDSVLICGTVARKVSYDLDFVTFHAMKPKQCNFPHDKISIEVDDTVAWKAKATKAIYVHNAEIRHMNPLVLNLTQNSLLIPSDSDDTFQFHPHPWWVEQYAGGFGGWSFAHTFMQPIIQHELRKVAIESHQQYAIQFALNHKTTVVGDLLSMPPEFLIQHPNDVLFITEIQDVKWQQQMQWLNHHLWTASSPCQSWSLAGHHAGLETQNGQALVHTICQAKIFKPKYLGLEQVAGFAEHKHFVLVKRLLTWANYRVVFEKVLDMSDVCPVRRSRWLALYQHEDVSCSNIEIQPWPKMHRPAEDFDALHLMEDADVGEFQPAHHVAAKYFSKDFFPGRNKQCTQAQIIDMRLPKLNEVLPTFMKQYGNAHNLDEDLLKSKGLFGAFIQQGRTFRFFTPYEIMKLHVQNEPATMLKPATLAWQTMGNAIMTPHALFVLFHVFMLSKWLADDTMFAHCLDRMIHMRLKTTNSQVLFDKYAWYLGSSEDNHASQTKLNWLIQQLQWTNQESHPMWPKGMFLDVIHGLCSFAPVDVPRSLSMESPTIEFQVSCQVALAVPPGEYGLLTVDANVTWRTLLSLWDFKLMPINVSLRPDHFDQEIMSIIDQSKVVLTPIKYLDCIPTVPNMQAVPTKLPLLHRQDFDLTLYEVENCTTWRQVRTQCKLPSHAMYDAFGQLHQELAIKHPILVDSTEHPFEPSSAQARFLHHLAQAKFEVIMPPGTDILVLYVTGTVQSMEAFATFWLSENQIRWCAKHGRQVNVQQLDTGAMQVLYRPQLPTTATPVSIFRKELFVTMMKTALRTLQQSDGIDWILKYQQRFLFRGHFAPDLSMSLIIPLFEHFFQMNPTRGTPALITMAKRCGDVCTLADLHARSKNQQFVLTMIGDPMIGGAGTKNPTTKQDHHKVIEVGIANLFLEYGVNISSVPDSTAALLHAAGEPRLHTLLFAEAPPQKYTSFEMLCAAAKIELPQHGPRYAQVNSKFKKLRSKEGEKQQQSIDVSQYALNDQFFRNADDSQATILQQYTPQSSGVMLLNSLEAEPWLYATTDLAPDELALYVIGDIKIPDQFHVTRIHAPARDNQGREVLLNGKLVQMGSKHIRTMVGSDTIELNDIQVCSITVWRETIDPALWARIAAAPVRTVKELLTLEGHAGIMGKPWGRTFHKDGVKVDAGIATSMQFHCEMQKGPRFEALLRRSGFNNIFLTPKDSDGQPSKAWRIIWMPLSPKELEAKTTTISGTAGLIKGRKAIGLRVEEAAFSAAWKRLKPDQDPPDQRILAHLFKLQPLPLGLDHTILRTWGESQGWDIKPIKPMGAKQWIVSADSFPPPVLSFNGHPVLCQKMHPKSLKPDKAIVAGPRSGSGTSSKNSAMAATYAAPELGTSELKPDPWKQYLINQQARQVHLVEDQRRTGNATPFPEQRTLSGPFADMFQQQDSRIKSVETMVAQLNETQNANKQALETQFASLDTRLMQHVTQTQAGFEHITQENANMQRSIADALGQQEERMARSFDDLKNIFLQNRGTKRKDTRNDKGEDEELRSASE